MIFFSCFLRISGLSQAVLLSSSALQVVLHHIEAQLQQFVHISAYLDSTRALMLSPNEVSSAKEIERLCRAKVER